MREIKFRAWSKEFKKMFYCEKGGLSFLAFHCDYWEWKIAVINDLITPDNGVLMQYTGLKDCKGREIYQGDVVINELYTPAKATIVAWKNILDTYPFQYWEQDGKDFNVLGNIYEHPHLLEEIDK